MSPKNNNNTNNNINNETLEEKVKNIGQKWKDHMHDELVNGYYK